MPACVVDRGDGRTFLKPPRAIRADEDMATYLLADRGFVPTITVVVPREMAGARCAITSTCARPRTPISPCAWRWPAALPHGGAARRGVAGHRRSQPHQCFGTGTLRFAAWLEQMQPLMPARAYHGAPRLGLCQADARARRGRWRPLRFTSLPCCAAVTRPRLAMVVLLQVLAGSRGSIALLADTAIGWLRMGLRERKTTRRARKLEQA